MCALFWALAECGEVDGSGCHTFYRQDEVCLDISRSLPRNIEVEVPRIKVKWLFGSAGKCASRNGGLEYR